MFKKLVTGTVALAIAATVQVGAVSAEGTHYVPSLSYRTGPYAGNGTPVANGFADYMNMLNERDGGIGGIKVEVEECETGYNTDRKSGV